MYIYDKNKQACVDKENLGNSLYSGSLSNIDLQVDQHLYQSVQDTANSNLAEKFKFPKTDPIIINMHEDKRTVNEKFRDVISIINQKIPEDLAEVWSEICNRDVRHPCYYRSGLSYLASDLKKLSKEFQYAKKIKTQVKKWTKMPNEAKTKVLNRGGP